MSKASSKNLAAFSGSGTMSAMWRSLAMASSWLLETEVAEHRAFSGDVGTGSPQKMRQAKARGIAWSHKLARRCYMVATGAAASNCGANSDVQGSARVHRACRSAQRAATGRGGGSAV